ncbi:MAG: hypothetical protein AAGG72_08810, partial [Pseudomonadota bacterium]
HPLGAAGAVLVVRLFTSMVRDALSGRDALGGPGSGPSAGGGEGEIGMAPSADGQPRWGTAVIGARGGLGLACLFEAVGRRS